MTTSASSSDDDLLSAPGVGFPDTEEAYIICDAFVLLQGLANDNAVRKGFWNVEKPIVMDLCLMHSELSEALEAVRHGNPPSEHIPEFSGLEEELADVIIRIADVSRHHNLRLGAAVVAKMRFNTGREKMHGGKAF